MTTLDKFRLTAVTWDSDKEPNGFHKWIGLMGSLVRSTAGGEALENFLDAKLGRNIAKTATVPSFLQDPDFDPPPVIPPDLETDGAEAATSAAPDDDGSEAGFITQGSVTGGEAQDPIKLGRLLPAATPYRSLPQESRTLDGLMYNVLKMNVKGTKSHLIDCVSFPSHVQAVCVLYNHQDISRSDRKTQAFAQMDNLQMKGDVKQWHIEAISAIKELFNSKCTIMDYALMCIMKSLSGKSKTIQYKIADDINTQEITEFTNVFDMIQEYCSLMSSVGDGNSKPTNYTEEEKQRFKAKKEAERKKAAANNGGKKCTYCGGKNHKAAECYGNPSSKNFKGTDRGLHLRNKAGATKENSQKSDSQSSTSNAVQDESTSLTVEDLRQLLSRLNQGKRVLNVNSVEPNLQTICDGKWISLCSGMDCAALLAKQFSIAPSEYLSVEISDKAQRVANAANPSSDHFCGLNHHWKSDVLAICEDDILDLGREEVSFISFGAPCEDFSILRLLPPRHKGDELNKDNPRPGLKGQKGRIFLECIKILKWVLKYNPKCKYLVENVVFDDLYDDWNQIISELGEPIIIEAADHSSTRRKRAYWTNLEIDLESTIMHLTPIDGDQFMDDGRTLVKVKSNDKEQVRTIGKSWKGSAEEPVANTKMPVLVNDVKHDDPQQLRPHEAEQLLGMPKGCTAGDGITNKDRLTAIGNAWDLRVTGIFMEAYRNLYSRTTKHYTKYCKLW